MENQWRPPKKVLGRGPSCVARARLAPPVPRDWPGVQGNGSAGLRARGWARREGGRGCGGSSRHRSPPHARADTTELRAQERTSRVRRGRPPVSGDVDTLGFLVAPLCPRLHYFLNYSAAAQCQRVWSQDKAHSHSTRKVSQSSAPKAGSGWVSPGQGQTTG